MLPPLCLIAFEIRVEFNVVQASFDHSHDSPSFELLQVFSAHVGWATLREALDGRISLEDKDSNHEFLGIYQRKGMASLSSL